MAPMRCALLALFAGAAAKDLRIAMYSGEGAILTGDADYPYIPVLTEAAQGLTPAAHLEILNGTTELQAKLNNVDFDMVFFPGGWSTGQAHGLGDDGMEAVKSFVHNGGGYVGTCGGAWLGLEFLRLYGDGPDGQGIPADELGEGDSHVAFSEEALRDEFTQLDLSSFANESTLLIHYQGGPTIPEYKTVLPRSVGILASYTEDLPSDRGAHEGAGTPAITYSVYGSGRVVLNAPHPEHALSESGVGVPIYRGELAWAARWGEESLQAGEEPAQFHSELHV